MEADLFQGQGDESVVEETSLEVVVEQSTTTDAEEEYQQILAKVKIILENLDPQDQ